MGMQKYEDQIGCGPFVQGDQILGDHLSMGNEFDGDCLSSRTYQFLWGLAVQWDRKSGNQMDLGQNVSF